MPLPEEELSTAQGAWLLAFHVHPVGAVMERMPSGVPVAEAEMLVGETV